jgi:hypothetical protein
MISYLEARGIEPCFQRRRPARSRTGFIREDSGRVSSHGNAWMELDVISFVVIPPSVALCCHFSGCFGRLAPFDRCLLYFSVLPDLFGRFRDRQTPWVGDRTHNPRLKRAIVSIYKTLGTSILRLRIFCCCVCCSNRPRRPFRPKKYRSMSSKPGVARNAGMCAFLTARENAR